MQLEPAHLISPIVSCLKVHGILHVKAFVDIGMQLPEKYKEKFDVSSEGPSSGS